MLAGLKRPWRQAFYEGWLPKVRQARLLATKRTVEEVLAEDREDDEEAREGHD